MIKVCNATHIAENRKCEICGSKKGLREIILANDYTGNGYAIYLCKSCCKKLESELKLTTKLFGSSAENA